jgi:DNA-binding protein HU-beta
MNKQDLIGKIAETAGLARADSAKAVDAMLDIITAALKAGDDVRLVGFGSFEVSQRKASVGRNPRTGEPMEIDACGVPKFRPGKALKDSVN